MPATYNFPSVKTGDTWRHSVSDPNPLVCAGFSYNGGNMPVALELVILQFRNPETGALGISLRSDGASPGIEITNAATWAFRIKKRRMTLPPGEWKYDIELFDANGDSETWIEGVLPVTPDQSKP